MHTVVLGGGQLGDAAGPRQAGDAAGPRQAAMMADQPAQASAGVPVEVTGLAVGGDGVGRAPDGRVVFVAGAVPGDRATVVLRSVKRRHAHGELLTLDEPSPDRVEPRCPHVAEGCGGCSLQQLAEAAQRAHKRTIVVDALARLGHIADPPVVDGPDLARWGFRTSVRMFAAETTGLGFRHARSHQVVNVASCAVAHPLLAELITAGRYGRARTVILRAGAATGERLVITDGPARDVEAPEGVRVVEQRGTATAPRFVAAGPDYYHEVVAGRRWRVSAGSFFQTRTDGAEALVAVVAAELATAALGREPVVLDAYCGVGLLSAAVSRASVIGVEANPFAVADAKVNLADRDADISGQPFERWTARPVDAVIADPSRKGLGQAGVDVVAATGAAVVVLVSCDAASLGRDAGLFALAGYRLDRSTVLDFFPHTAHVEVVSRFTHV